MVSCEVEGCCKPVLVKGLCDMHRKRLERTGALFNTRPEDWGQRNSHPLYNTWLWVHKMKAKYEVAKEWNDFWSFVAIVGERPSPTHRLMRIKEEFGYGPDNFYWKEIIQSDTRAEYARKWRNANPEKAKNSELKTRFGLSLVDYNVLLEKQGNVCAICKQSCSSGNSLAVDHDHETKKIRGLLCSNCNNLLGRAKDSIDILNNAINYLKGN